MGTRWFAAVVVTTWLAAGVLSVTLWVAARGARVPAAASILFAGLPWFLGVAAERSMIRWAIRDGRSAVPYLLSAVGPRLVGAWCSSALAMAVAVGFASAFHGRRLLIRRSYRERAPFVFVVAVFALAACVPMPTVFGSGRLYGIVSSVGVLLVLSWALSAARDVRHAGERALLAAIVPAAFICCLGGITTMEASAFCGAIWQQSSPFPMSATPLLWEHAEAFRVGDQLAEGATLVLGLAAIAASVWANARIPKTVDRIARGAALLLVSFAIVGADIIASRRTAWDVAALAPDPWRHLHGFTPVTIVGAPDEILRRRPPVATVTVDAILPFGGDPIPLMRLDSGPTRRELVPALRAARARVKEGWPPYWRLRTLEACPTPTCDSLPNGQELPAMTLAIDARVTAGVLRTLFDAARQAGVRALELVGSGESTPPTAIAQLEEAAPLFAVLARRVVSVTVLLEDALPTDYAAADPLLWHATVTHAAEGEFATRPRTGRLPKSIPCDTRPRWYGGCWEDGYGRPHSAAYLALANDATARTLVTFADAAVQHGLQPVVVTGAVPGHPEEPPAPR